MRLYRDRVNEEIMSKQKAEGKQNENSFST